MIINCSKSLLSETLSVVSKGVSTKSSLSVLEGIFLKAENGFLTLISNDLSIGIEAKIEAEIIEEGTAVLNAKMLIAIIRSLPLEEVKIEVNEFNKAIIKSGYSKFEITGCDPKEFPELTKFDSDYSIEISNEILKNMINKTSFAVSTSDIKPVLKGCLVEIEGNSLKMVAVDKFRMAIREEILEESFEKRSMIIPEKTLSEIAKILKDGEDKVKISCNNKNVIFITENYKIVSRLIEGEFIKYNSAISDSFETELECSKAEIYDVIQRASLMLTSDALKAPLKINILDDNIKITCETTSGNFEDNIKIPTGDTNLLIGFNNAFLTDALRACEDEMIKLKFNKNINPLVITPVEGNKFLYLVLPMKI